MVEEGEPGWDEGVLKTCATMGRAHKGQADTVEMRRYEGMIRLLGKVLRGGGSGGAKGDAKRGAKVEKRARLSDGTPADHPRKALVV